MDTLAPAFNKRSFKKKFKTFNLFERKSYREKEGKEEAREK